MSRLIVYANTMLIKKGWLDQNDVDEKSHNFNSKSSRYVTIYIYIKIVTIS